MSRELLHVLTNNACPTQILSYQNIPTQLQERLSETVKRFLGEGKVGGWVRRCDELSSKALQARRKLEMCKYGKGEKGKPLETREDSKKATLGKEFTSSGNGNQGEKVFSLFLQGALILEGSI